MKEIMTIVRSLEYCGLLIEGVTQTIENETKGSPYRHPSVV